MENNLEKEFVSYEQAVALKELGFEEEGLAHYIKSSRFWNDKDKDKIYLRSESLDYDDTDKEYVIENVPLKQQVFRWFREKYDLHHVVILDSDTNNFDAGVFGELVIPFLEEDTIFTTYEEAENACIDKLIEMAKQQDK